MCIYKQTCIYIYIERERDRYTCYMHSLYMCVYICIYIYIYICMLGLLLEGKTIAIISIHNIIIIHSNSIIIDYHMLT